MPIVLETPSMSFSVWTEIKKGDKEILILLRRITELSPKAYEYVQAQEIREIADESGRLWCKN
jgi:hypothetical protein